MEERHTEFKFLFQSIGKGKGSSHLHKSSVLFPPRLLVTGNCYQLKIIWWPLQNELVGLVRGLGFSQRCPSQKNKTRKPFKAWQDSSFLADRYICKAVGWKFKTGAAYSAESGFLSPLLSLMGRQKDGLVVKALCWDLRDLDSWLSHRFSKWPWSSHSISPCFNSSTVKWGITLPYLIWYFEIEFISDCEILGYYIGWEPFYNLEI